MRRTFMAPEELTPQVVSDVLSLAGSGIPVTVIAHWTETEMLVAYDWAVRVYLHASDNIVQQREKPHFVTLQEV